MEDEIAVQNKATNDGNVCLRKARRKRHKLLITELFFDYTRDNTLHGIPYFTKRDLTITEKLFWIVTFIVSVALCSFSIYQLWYRWKTSPVIVTISEQVVPVGMVPFPSITICPQAKCKVSVYNYTDEIIQLRKLVDEYIKKLTAEKNMTYDKAFWFVRDNVTSYESINPSIIERINKLNDIDQICMNHPYLPHYQKYRNSSLIKYFHEVSPRRRELFISCKNPRFDLNCYRTFEKVLTKEGVCYTTNSLSNEEIFRTNEIQHDYKYLHATTPSKGWNIDSGYDSSVLYPYPRHGMENAVEPELVVELKENVTDRNDLCNTLSNGFKVYIHHPLDLPQPTLYFYGVIKDQVSSMALSFNVVNTSETLRSYSPEDRQCYFSDERYLKYFRNYTEKNCWIECLSNQTFKECGCVMYYMPHNNSEQICGEGSLNCFKRAQSKLVRTESRSVGGCHCLPACISVDYEAEILKTDYDKVRENKNAENIFNISMAKHTYGYKYSRLEVYYKRPRFLSMRRSELFGITEFIANCGGLLGLFLGFSFLTVVELFYYLTLRLWCTLKKDLEEEKTQRKIKKQDTEK